MSIYKNDKSFALDNHDYADGLSNLYECGNQDFDFNAYVYDESYPNWRSADADDALHSVSDGLQGYSQAMDLSYTINAMNKATGVPKKLVYFLDSSYGEALKEYKQPLLSENYWDCECENNYIHSLYKSRCNQCNCEQNDMPNSIMSEVERLTETYQVEVTRTTYFKCGVYVDGVSHSDASEKAVALADSREDDLQWTLVNQYFTGDRATVVG